MPEDYHRFAAAREPLDGCCTHFVSTHAYTHHPSVSSDLRQHDTQSHGHFHHVYREPEANRVNLERAHRILWSSGFEPVGFAGPHGRWRRSLDDQLEDLGYLYSSDFQLGYDDFPFYPWKGEPVLADPSDPGPPGLRGAVPRGGRRSIRASSATISGRSSPRKLDAGELAVIYGHPERRLGRMPEVMTALARAIDGQPLVWRATFSELARWWRWRAERRWLVIPREDQPPGDPVRRVGHRIRLRPGDPPRPLPLFDARDGPADVARARRAGLRAARADRTGARIPRRSTARPLSLKRAVRTALDWETVTPLDEIPRSSISEPASSAG